MKLGSPDPALQYPMFIRHNLSALPIAVFALFTTPGPMAEVPWFIPACLASGPFTSIKGASV